MKTLQNHPFPQFVRVQFWQPTADNTYKALLLKVMEEGVEIRNRWFDSRNANSKRTRFVESAFARIRSRGNEVVFQLDKVVGLPGKKAR